MPAQADLLTIVHAEDLCLFMTTNNLQPKVLSSRAYQWLSENSLKVE